MGDILKSIGNKLISAPSFQKINLMQGYPEKTNVYTTAGFRQAVLNGLPEIIPAFEGHFPQFEASKFVWNSEIMEELIERRGDLGFEPCAAAAIIRTLTIGARPPAEWGNTVLLHVGHDSCSVLVAVVWSLDAFGYCLGTWGLGGGRGCFNSGWKRGVKILSAF